MIICSCIQILLLSFFFRYWNDKDVLQKLGEAMGLAVPGDAATSAETSGLDETEEAGNEDESIVHHTASVGDVEVTQFYLLVLGNPVLGAIQLIRSVY